MFQPARWLLACVRISSAHESWHGDHQQHQQGVQRLETLDADAPENFGTRTAPWATWTRLSVFGTQMQAQLPARCIQIWMHRLS